jgi:di/tricarboxylate transporter
VSVIELMAQPHFAAYLTLAVLVVMFVLFVLEILPVEVTAMLGAAALVVFGVLPPDDTTPKSMRIAAPSIATTSTG